MASDWRPSTWGEEITLEYGKALRGHDKAQGQYRVYGSNGPIGWTTEPLAPGPGVVLGRKGAYRGVRYSPDPFFVIDTAYYVAPRNPDLDMRWLYYAINHYKLGEIDDGSPIPSTTRAAVYVRELQVPPISEQRAIGHMLGALDDKIDLNRRLSETLDAMAQAIFKSWFVGFDPARAKAEGRATGLPNEVADLFPDELTESSLGSIPRGWRVASLRDEFALTMGQSPPGSTYNEVGEGTPFYQGRADFSFRFPRRRVYCTAPSRFAEANDTLVSVRAPVGDINLARERCAIGRGVAAVRHGSGSASYTFEMMRRLRSNFLSFEAEGTVFGSIGKKDFEALPCIVPPSELVERFEEMSGPLSRRMANLEDQIQTLVQIRELIRPLLISGNLRVPDIERVLERVAL